jgi:1,4-alpha-glucan branching enzyme
LDRGRIMKIHTVTARFHPSVGGVETRILALSKRFVKRGHEVTVHTTTIGPGGKQLPDKGEVHGIKIVRYKPRFNLGYFISYWKPAIEDADILDLHGYPALYNDLTVKRYKKRYPLVYTPHGVSLPPKTRIQALMRSTYDRIFGFKSLKAAKMIITMTKDEEKWCRSHNIVSAPFQAIPSGVEDEAFEVVDPNEVKSRFGVEDYILFIGRIHREKAPFHLVRALAKLKEKKDVKLVFVGPDLGEAENLKAEAKRLELESRVVLTKKVSEEDKRALLSGCRFFVNPSSFEAQGVVFFEAWAQKKPVIGTNVGGVPFLVRDSETGLLYNYGDIDSLAKHIKFLLENPQKADAMGRKGYEIVTRDFRWESITDRVEEVFSRIMGNA